MTAPFRVGEQADGLGPSGVDSQDVHALLWLTVGSQANRGQGVRLTFGVSPG